jgi:hypothetical protein
LEYDLRLANPLGQVRHHPVHRLQVGDLIQVLGDLSWGVEQPEVLLVLELEVDLSNVEKVTDCVRDDPASFRSITYPVQVVRVPSLSS